MAPLVKSIFARFFQSKKAILLQEAQQMNGFMRLLMKRRNTGVGWTREEVAELRAYFKRFTVYGPVLACVVLPGGFLLLPLLAGYLDRRTVSRKKWKIRS